MASPQLENGYLQVSIELFDALVRIRIPGEARQVFDFVIRKTYGFHKKSDRIALSQFNLGTGMSVRSVCKALRKLAEMNLIKIEGQYTGNIYSINKDYLTWRAVPKRAVPLRAKLLPKRRKLLLPKRADTKDTIKNTITKDTKHMTPAELKKIQSESGGVENPNEQIVLVIGKFAKVNPGMFRNFYKMKSQRKAIDRLLTAYQLDSVVRMVDDLPRTNKMRYMAKAYSPIELERNYARILDAKKTKTKII